MIDSYKIYDYSTIEVNCEREPVSLGFGKVSIIKVTTKSL